MKKKFCALFALLMTVCLLSGCGEKMPVPEYPLTEEFVLETLEAHKFNWTIDSEESWTDGHKVYNMVNADGNPIAEISSIVEGETRYVSMAFYSNLHEGEDKIPLDKKEWVYAIGSATTFFGDFKKEYKAYDDFTGSKKGDAISTLRPDMADEGDRIFYRTIVWKNDYDENFCEFKFGEADPPESILEQAEQSFVRVTLYNSEDLKTKMMDLEIQNGFGR